MISSRSEAFSDRDGISLHPFLGQDFHCEWAGKKSKRMKMNVLPWGLLKVQRHLKSQSRDPQGKSPVERHQGLWDQWERTFIRKLCKWVLRSRGWSQDTLSAVSGGWKEYLKIKSFNVPLHSNIASLIWQIRAPVVLYCLHVNELSPCNRATWWGKFINNLALRYSESEKEDEVLWRAASLEEEAASLWSRKVPKEWPHRESQGNLWDCIPLKDFIHWNNIKKKKNPILQHML